MGFFDFLKAKPVELEGVKPPISKDLFIDDSDPQGEGENHSSMFFMAEGLIKVYELIQKDYESLGFQHSMTNPDESNLIDNLELISRNLDIAIEQARTYYDDQISEVDFHISSRERLGMVDLVEELKMRRNQLGTHVDKLNQFSQEVTSKEGIYRRIYLSYKNGFMKGLKAITEARVLNKKVQ